MAIRFRLSVCWERGLGSCRGGDWNGVGLVSVLGRGKAKAKRKKAIDHGRKTEAGRLEAFIYAIMPELISLCRNEAKNYGKCY